MLQFIEKGDASEGEKSSDKKDKKSKKSKDGKTALLLIGYSYDWLLY